MAEQIANKGYFGLVKETTKGVAVTPSVYVPMYDDAFMTDVALDEDAPIIGNKFARYQSLLGMRKHGGEATLLAEANTAAHLVNMILTKGSDSGGGPYTHPFTLSTTADPKSYTIDIQKGQLVERYMGAEISELDIDFDKNKMLFKAKFSALKSFIVREISAVAGTGPYTVTLKTNYDPNPTDGLVVGDVIRVRLTAGTTIDATIATVPNGQTFTCVANVSSAADGDLVYLRAATPSYTLRAPFMWALTEFRFGSNAAAALAATQTRVEQGSKWKLIHKFEDDAGAQRSGAFDPAALVRTLGDIEVDLKKFFDTPEDENKFLTSQSKALVIRHFSEDGLYELRVTLDSYKFKENPVKSKSGEILYAEGKVIPDYNTSNGQSWDVKVLNALTTV